MIQRDQKPWDKLFMTILLVLWVGWIVLMGLDAGRFHRSRVPLIMQIVGVGLIGIGSYLVWLTFREQLCRAGGQDPEGARASRGYDRTLCLCAPSDVCGRARFPARRAALARLMVGPCRRGCCLVLAMSFRAVLEERALKAELEGYADYAARVRYRLVPYLW